MSLRFPARLKTQLGGCLATLYRRYGKVAPRRVYHEDDTGTGGGGSELDVPKPLLFEDHPLLNEIPIGAPSDLSSILIADERTIDETNKRSEELTAQLQNRLELELGQKKRKQLLYQTRPQPY